MKRKFISLTALAAVAIAMVFYGCQKADTDDTSPVITVLGANPATVVIHTAYADAGATASDNVSSGYIAVFNDVSATNPDTGTIGTYTIHYSATDGSGNEGHATRTVNVVSVRDFFIGNYQVQDSNISSQNPSFFGDTAVAGMAADQLIFKNFADYGFNCVATVSGSTLFIAQQSFGTDTILATSGTLNATSKTISLTYFHKAITSEEHRSIYTKQ